MSSSESDDDDCYGNIAQKLNTMKSKYIADKIESTNLLDDSLSKIIDKTTSKQVVDLTSLASVAPKDRESFQSLDTDDLMLDKIIENNTNKRTTRRSKRNLSDISINNILPERSTRSRKGRKSNTTAVDLDSVEVINVSAEELNASCSERGRGANRRSRGRGIRSPRGRGRGRTRGANTSHSRGRSGVMQSTCSYYPSYSVGNTDEYPDACDEQQLFTNRPTSDDIVCIEDENNELEENEELSVKVYWQSCEIYKFMIRRYQKFTQLFDYFAKKANVSEDKLFFTYNEKIIKMDATPDSISYSIVKFIDGGIVNQSVSQLVTEDTKDSKGGIKIKFQCQNMKKPFEVAIGNNDKLSQALMKCAEHLERPIDKLKFYFDGDLISGKNTVSDLELEGGECIDVKIIS